MIQILIDNPLLVLFLTAAIGYPLGRIKIRGSSLGVAAILFVGLAIGALDPNIKLPEVLYQLGLVMFVYTIGLSSGPGFFASLQRRGLRDNLLVVLMLLLATGLTVVSHFILQLTPALTAGIFTGSLTNTPALASVLDTLKNYSSQANTDLLLAQPVVGYSLTYPMGVVGMIIAITVVQRLWKVNYAKEAHSLPDSDLGEGLKNYTVKVTRPEATQIAIEQLVLRQEWDVIFGRLQHGGNLSLSGAQSQFELGDLVSVIGSLEELERVTNYLGEQSEQELEFDRSQDRKSVV